MGVIGIVVTSIVFVAFSFFLGAFLYFAYDYIGLTFEIVRDYIRRKRNESRGEVMETIKGGRVGEREEVNDER